MEPHTYLQKFNSISSSSVVSINLVRLASGLLCFGFTRSGCINEQGTPHCKSGRSSPFVGQMSLKIFRRRSVCLYHPSTPLALPARAAVKPPVPRSARTTRLPPARGAAVKPTVPPAARTIRLMLRHPPHGQGAGTNVLYCTQNLTRSADTAGLSDINWTSKLSDEPAAQATRDRYIRPTGLCHGAARHRCSTQSVCRASCLCARALAKARAPVRGRGRAGVQLCCIPVSLVMCRFLLLSVYFHPCLTLSLAYFFIFSLSMYESLSLSDSSVSVCLSLSLPPPHRLLLAPIHTQAHSFYQALL